MESGKQASDRGMKEVPSPFGRNRGWMVFWAALVLLVLAGAWAGKSWSKPEAAAKAAFDPAKHFTIEKIEPDPAKEEIRVFFSHPLPLGFLQQHLRLLPRSKVDWNRSTITDGGWSPSKAPLFTAPPMASLCPGTRRSRTGLTWPR